MKQGKTLAISMITGAAIGAAASLAIGKMRPKKSVSKTAGNAIKAFGSFVEHMNL